ncbi:DUF1294 domain-containing protein [Oxalicibacterium solurbis]|uniref:DUF1294 domain-containing protein n=1 Tax=Oxalicibacterium solurbis TaxID=69280 RepID=A0A8J3AUK4_9BURK|nr:DUF1294 domain-containing protein [Oxalicibacterium solurbis]GGI53485.1 hypothetical protein GCM10011430_06590 [Oxalicibacterium solurbis]
MRWYVATWLLVPAVYGVLSLISFSVYASDKRAACRGERRIAERTLHLVDLMGGWPGGWLAQKSLRHKCSKRSFQKIYWVTVVLHCAIVGWLLAPSMARLFGAI